MPDQATSRAATVEFEHVTKRYGRRQPEDGAPGAVNDLSLAVPAGKICVLVGPSGCGKTTSLKMVNRLMQELVLEPLKPDISYWRDGRCTFVGDVKYKRIEFEGYKNADLYQLLAYCIATDLPGGLLIYAAGEGEPFRHEVVNLGRTLEVVTLDLTATPASLLDQVAAVAGGIETQATSAHAA